jgi:uncharacterized protein (TIGR01777 family)
MDEKILITGATGLVGKQLVSRCLQNGISVNYLTTGKVKHSDSPNVKGFSWNPADSQIDTACFDGVSAIVNLAGSSISKPWTVKGKDLILKSRTDSIACLHQGLTAVGSHQVNYIVSASAIGGYPSSESVYYSEQDQTDGNGFLAEVVRAWEASLQSFQDIGITAGILRIGLVMAKEGGVLPVLTRPIRLGLGAPLGNGRQWQSWIHIEDLVSIICFALEHRLEGVYNAVSPNPVTNTKLTQEAAQILNRPIWMPPVPAFMMKLIMGERSQLALDSQRVCASKIQEEGFSFAYPNVVPALVDLLEVKK